MTDNLKRNWPHYLMITILIPALGWLLIFDRQNLKESDAACLKQATEVCRRVDRLEENYKVTMQNFHNDMKDMKGDIRTIKNILITNLRSAEGNSHDGD